MTPVGIPLVPLPVISNVPPAANVPPVCKLPVRAPVLKLIVPRLLPVIRPPPRPFTAIRVDPERVKPLLLPDSVPPLLVKSTLPAKAANGSARTRIVRKIVLLIMCRVSWEFTRSWGKKS